MLSTSYSTTISAILAAVSSEIVTLVYLPDDDDAPANSDDDAEKRLEFSRHLGLPSSKYGDYRHLKHLRHCVRTAE